MLTLGFLPAPQLDGCCAFTPLQSLQSGLFGFILQVKEMDRKQSKINFVGLHAHSVAGSIFDALGYPQDHMDFAYENGNDALALTDHGKKIRNAPVHYQMNNLGQRSKMNRPVSVLLTILLDVALI